MQEETSVEGRLQEAIDEGKTLDIVYRGGSQPGTCRVIAPMSIKDGNVIARCYASDTVKSFALEKIHIVEGDGEPESPRWRPGVLAAPLYSSISDLLENERKLLGDLGWYVEGSEDSISLHRRFKNGNPLKAPDVSLGYEEYAYDLVFGADGELHKENKRKRQRPWSVMGKNQETRTYGSLDAAAGTFLEWAGLLAPAERS